MRRKVRKILEKEINPYVASHGGSIDVVDVVDGNIYLRMSGGCQGCSSAAATLRSGVESALRKHLGDTVKNIIDVTDHAGGENPYA